MDPPNKKSSQPRQFSLQALPLIPFQRFSFSPFRPPSSVLRPPISAFCFPNFWFAPWVFSPEQLETTIGRLLAIADNLRVWLFG
jgi:hypothetical protein